MKKQSSKRRLSGKKYNMIYMYINIAVLCAIIIFFFVGFKNIFTNKNEYREKGIKCFNEKQYEKAISYFDQAIDCNQWFSDKTDVDILMYKADCYIKMEQFILAKQTYEYIENHYKKKYYDDDSVKFGIDICDALEKYKNGKYDTIISTFVEAVEKGHKDIAIYAACCFESEKRYEEMKQYLDIYSTAYEKTSFVCYKYTSYYVSQKDYDNALASINEGYSSNDDVYQKQLHYAEIMCYEEKGDFANALKSCESYISLYPDDKNGQEIYQYIYSRVNVNTNPVNDIFNQSSENTNQ